ncbi:MAG: alpha-glucosidase/alpha-galactosidase [Clostridia bacterium]|nr:alpha-glucosidase/alpha-galactosidase [Clostridia bacterium]
MKELNIAYIGGGSMAWARNLMNDLVIEEELFGTVRLYDIDYKAALKNEKIGNLYNNSKGAVTTWNYMAANTIEEALEGADFVIISILPGTFDDMEQDVHYPQRYGIYQSVGDTTGPGGIMRSVRAIPMYEIIARKIKEICPEAYIISYTNPMTVLIKTIYEVFPEARAFGCCHEVFGTQRLIACMLENLGVAEKVSRKDIGTNVLGINHFTWVDKIDYKGIDVFSEFMKFARDYHESGFCENGNWNDTYFSSGHRVMFDLFLQYGIVAAAGDRHLAEFCPGWYLKNPETAAYWQFSLTPVSWRKADRMERMEKTNRLYSGLEAPVISETGEEGVRLIKALCGLGNVKSNVNTINKGQHKGLPTGAVVETNAWFSDEGIRPANAGRLPYDVESLVLRHVYNQNQLVRACLDRNEDGVLGVFLNDPLVHLPKGDAVKLFKEMFRMNEVFWNRGEHNENI